MAKINKEEYLNDLLNQIDVQISFGESLREAEQSSLLFKENENKWNALECIQHMNQSMQVYTDQLAHIVLQSEAEDTVKIGWKGNFFAEGSRPKGEEISYKMKTMKALEPNKASSESIDNYISLLELIKTFITQNKDRSWTKGRVKTALGPLVKLNIAEAINFVLAHNDRHILQAKKAMPVNIKI